MANFGFARLAVVAPYEPHWREAKSAVGASALLQNAKRAERLQEAVAGCTLAVGTASLGNRTPEQQVIPLPELAPRVSQEIARGGRVALIFGSEKRGLTRDDLAQCHVLTEIPTDSQQPSMNLGQAVAVCLYEIATHLDPKATGLGTPGRDCENRDRTTPASSRDLELLAGVIEETTLAANYSPAGMRAANRHDLDLLLRKLAFTERDALRTLALFRRILWKLKRNSTLEGTEQRHVTRK